MPPVPTTAIRMSLSYVMPNVTGPKLVEVVV
jgi:hypothetical protein